MQTGEQHLQRSLGPRQMQFIALGAAIGAGLFYGSAHTIRMAGPSIILAYLVCGAVVFLVMRALGEMAVHHPVAGSFSVYARDYLGPFAGYLTGWNYWFLWLVACVAELTAVGVYMRVWFPHVPQWIWAFLALGGMGLVNVLSVRAFGEFEFWFSLVKVVTIVLLVVSGIVMIVFGYGHRGATGIANLWSHGGFFPHGATGVLTSLQMVVFAYQGVELVGVAAGEATDPQRSIPRSIDAIFWRIVIFYGGALFVILSIYPWDAIDPHGSPFVSTFEQMGVHTAAGIVNFVVVTAALSTCNGGIFSTARMLYSLAAQGHAPRSFALTSPAGVPLRGVCVSVCVLIVGVLFNYLAPGQVFTWATAIATFCGVWTWSMILVAQTRFRAHLRKHGRAGPAYRMPWAPYSGYGALVFLLGVLVLMGYFPDTRIAVIVGPLWILALSLCYAFMRYRPRRDEESAPDRRDTAVRACGCPPSVGALCVHERV